jgi:autonomous glycyl radical cofactor GrcA
MVDTINITKAINGYIVKSNWLFDNSSNIIFFKDMKTLVRHLDDCFVKPFDKIVE